jgi:uncharacterized membrane protein SpoIIM required for sporulation
VAEPEPLERLRGLLARDGRRLDEGELLELPRLYRHACSQLARLELEGEDPARARELRALIAHAQGVLLSEEEAASQPLAERALRYLLSDCPRALRAEWRLVAVAGAVFYALAALAYAAVLADLDRAYSLLAPAVVESEIQQLAALSEGEPFRGNFDFGLGESPLTAGWILLHNLGVGVLFFAAALVPPLYVYVLGSNALMLGTYTAVAGHWGQAGAISSILWTHGVLELQALVLAGTAGLVLVRAWLAPGPYSRGHAMERESRRALALFAPVVPMLVTAGVIEGFVSPHAPLGVRLAVALASGLALCAWIIFGGRGAGGAAPARRARVTG